MTFDASGGNGASGSNSTGRSDGSFASNIVYCGYVVDGVNVPFHECGAAGGNPSSGALDGGAGGPGSVGGFGGDGASGGVGGAGAGGAGGTIRLVGSVIDADQLTIDAAGGAGGAGIASQPNGPKGGVGRFILSANVINGQSLSIPAGWDVASQGPEFFSGPMSANPYIGGAETPKLPNLVGGAEAYGLLSVSRAELLSSDFEDNVPDDAIAARSASMRRR